MEGTTLSLSPSSAGDFKICPQLFKFRKVDELPEPMSAAAARGSLVHAALERLFLDPPEERTPLRALALLETLWQEIRGDPEVRPEGMRDDEEAAWLAQGKALLGNYFRLEDPRKVRATRLEWWVEYELPELHLRGIIDRLEETDDGKWVLTDYKTGRIPGQTRELQAFFGLRFYALVCWRAFGVIPKEIRLAYLSDPAILTLHPHERMLTAFEKQVTALGAAIRRATERDDWRTRPTPFCMSCPFQSVCPAWESSENERERSRDTGL
jgi:putative RecB family exonuclease